MSRYIEIWKSISTTVLGRDKLYGVTHLDEQSFGCAENAPLADILS
jgi:hypothetical protein